jgi:hypothetical protein
MRLLALLLSHTAWLRGLQGPGCTEVSTTVATGLFDVSLILLFAHFYRTNYNAAAAAKKKQKRQAAAAAAPGEKTD